MVAKLIGYLWPLDQVLQRYPLSDKSLYARYARSIAYFRIGQLNRSLPGLFGNVGGVQSLLDGRADVSLRGIQPRLGTVQLRPKQLQVVPEMGLHLGHHLRAFLIEERAVLDRCDAGAHGVLDPFGPVRMRGHVALEASRPEAWLDRVGWRQHQGIRAGPVPIGHDHDPRRVGEQRVVPERVRFEHATRRLEALGAALVIIQYDVAVA